MFKSLRLWQFVASSLKTGQPVLLLVVAESGGSSPGRPGFKLVLNAGGRLFGSIGGGIMEVKLVELARKYLAATDFRASFKRQIHRAEAPRDRSGMICSGEQTVVFFRLTPADLSGVQILTRALKNGRPVTLRLSNDRETTFQALENERMAPDFHFDKKDDTTFVYQENAGFRYRLFLVGGGHCALALSELAVKLNFHVTVLDDRPALNTFVQNRFAHRKHRLENYDRVSGCIPEGQDIFVVIMTLGYRTDEIALRQLLPKKLRYLGLLGSAAKVNTLLDSLRRDGFTPEQLDLIRAPAGLPIASHTPEEIAVSIAAQLVAVRNERDQQDP